MSSDGRVGIPVCQIVSSSYHDIPSLSPLPRTLHCCSPCTKSWNTGNNRTLVHHPLLLHITVVTMRHQFCFRPHSQPVLGHCSFYHQFLWLYLPAQFQLEKDGCQSEQSVIHPVHAIKHGVTSKNFDFYLIWCVLKTDNSFSVFVKFLASKNNTNILGV